MDGQWFKIIAAQINGKYVMRAEEQPAGGRLGAGRGELTRQREEADAETRAIQK